MPKVFTVGDFPVFVVAENTEEALAVLTEAFHATKRQDYVGEVYEVKDAVAEVIPDTDKSKPN